MKKDISNNLKKYLLGNRIAALRGVISSLKADLKAILGDYVKTDGDISITADMDEISGRVVFNISFAAREIYEAGTVLK